MNIDVCGQHAKNSGKDKKRNFIDCLWVHKWREQPPFQRISTVTYNITWMSKGWMFRNGRKIATNSFRIYTHDLNTIRPHLYSRSHHRAQLQHSVCAQRCYSMSQYESGQHLWATCPCHIYNLDIEGMKMLPVNKGTFIFTRWSYSNMIAVNSTDHIWEIRLRFYLPVHHVRKVDVVWWWSSYTS